MSEQMLYSVPQALGHVPVSRSKFYELMAAGEIGTVHIGSRRFVPHAELERYVESLGVQGSGSTSSEATHPGVADRELAALEVVAPNVLT